jgi:hypothetical protein
MANSNIWAAIVRHESTVSLYPRRVLACIVALVVQAAVWLAIFHLLGLLNVLFGHPRISASVVLMASAVSIAVSCFLLSRIELPEETGAAGEMAAAAPGALKAVVALAAIPYAVFLANSFWAYPNGTDSIAYHVNVALTWLQTGSLRLDPGNGWQYCLPGNAEMPALVALSLGVEKAVAVGNILASILLAASVYLIGWKLTRRTAPSLLSAVVVTAIPIVLYQTFELYVELFGTAFMVAAVALLLWREKSPVLFVFLSACAAGVSFGVKPIFWLYGVIYAIGAIVQLRPGKPAPGGAAQPDRGRVPQHRRKCLALLAAGLLLTSGFWFIRAVLATGNPVYPMSLSLGGQTASGYSAAHLTHTATNYDLRIKSLVWQLEYPWTEPSPADGRLPFGSDRGSGPLFAALAAPGILFMIVQAVRRRTAPWESALLAGTLAALFLWAAELRVIRFSLPVMALSCALAAPLLAELLARSRRALLALCFAGLLMNAAYCLAGPVQRMARQFERRDWSRSTYYGYPPILDHLPPGSRVFDHHNRVWASMLAGAGLTNSARYWGTTASGDYIVRVGSPGREDAELLSDGAVLLYDAVPPSLYPKVAIRWRVYRLR